MSQHEYITSIRNEISRLNRIIDHKIMIGRSYKIEAKRHKALLKKLRQHHNPGFFGKLSSLMTREYA